MKRMGKKSLTIELSEPVTAIPDALGAYDLTLEKGQLVYSYDTTSDRTGITSLLADLQQAGLKMTDLQTQQSSLEEIFVSLVADKEGAA